MGGSGRAARRSGKRRSVAQAAPGWAAISSQRIWQEFGEAMRLGTRGRYAVMAMVDLARHGVTDTRGAAGASPAGPSRTGSVTLADISTRQEISQAYLEQLFAALRRAGLVASVRGPGGGYRLARRPEDISVAEVARAVDEPLAATRCEGKTTGCLGGGERCATHDLWDALGGHIEGFLASVSLEDVVARRVRRPAPSSSAPAEMAAA